MAITAAQRTLALQHLLAAVGSQLAGEIAPHNYGDTLADLLPGVTADQVVAFLQTALGTSVDTQLDTVLANLAALATSAETTYQARAAAAAADVTAFTVS